MSAPRGPDPHVPGEVVDLDTTLGPARAYVRQGAPDGGWLLLGHGAGGGVGAADLLAVAVSAHTAGWWVALVEQPWRVAGRRVAAPPARLDEAWLQVVPALLGGAMGGAPGTGSLVVGGRSAGARVACRTAGELGAAGVLCLAFPLHPPGRPERSRAHELEAGVRATESPTTESRVLVVQGRRDPFGSPADVAAAAPAASVVGVDGDHGLSRDVPAVVEAVSAWLPGPRRR